MYSSCIRIHLLTPRVQGRYCSRDEYFSWKALGYSSHVVHMRRVFVYQIYAPQSYQDNRNERFSRSTRHRKPVSVHSSKWLDSIAPPHIIIIIHNYICMYLHTPVQYVLPWCKQGRTCVHRVVTQLQCERLIFPLWVTFMVGEKISIYVRTYVRMFPKVQFV